MNTHYTAHLHGGEVVRPNHDIDALSVVGESSTVGIFLSTMPPADRIRFLRELSGAASDLANVIAARGKNEVAA